MSGSVTDANGNPASGVQVLVFCPGDTWIGSYRSSTASDGTYAIGGLRPADCRVVFVSPAGSGLATEWFDDAPNRSLATDITVSPGQTDVGIDAHVDETGAISGSVTDANGNPVSGVELWAFDPGDGFLGFDGTSTASDGAYTVGNLRAAKYRVVFRRTTESGLARPVVR
jgi:hypothetical protein